MIAITCPRCGNNQQVDDTMGGTKLPCPYCKQRLLIPSAASAMAGNYSSAVPSPLPVTGTPGRDWFYQQSGLPVGPVPLLELRRLAREGVLKPEALLWTGGMAAWQAANRAMPKLFATKSADDYEVADAKARKWEGIGVALFAVIGGVALLAVVVGLMLPRLLQKQEAISPTAAVVGNDDKARVPAEHAAKGGDPNKAMPAEGGVYQRVLHSCVWIFASDGTKIWTGSGSLIDRDQRFVLTNQHVANESCKELLVIFPAFRDDKQLIAERSFYMREIKERGIAAHLVKADRPRDLAVIQLDKLPADATAIRLAKESVSIEQEIHCIGGSPKGNEQGMWISSHGKVRQVYEFKWHYDDGFPREATIIASDMGTNEGDSGGPIFNNGGVLVGVNAMGNGDSSQNAKHIDIREVREFLPKCYAKLGQVWKEPQ